VEGKMRIIHLSDFHINNMGIKDISDFITKALIEDLEHYNNDRKIDLILFSGDMIDKGGVSFGDNINDAF
jgi:predicted MPP superfamily phosphohydrolase